MGARYPPYPRARSSAVGPFGGFAMRCFGGIDDSAVMLDDGAGRQGGRLEVSRSKDVEHLFARGEEVVGDDAPMATPPHCLGAHDGAAMCAAQGAQSRQAGGKRRRQRIVGKIAKARNLPIAIGRRRRVTLPSPEPAELGKGVVADLPGREARRQIVTVELRIGARAWDRSHVDDEVDSGFAEQIDEFGTLPRRMPYGEK